MLTVTVTNGEVTYIRQLVFLVFAQKKWGKGHFKGFTIHTSFPSSMQIISVMNIQQCISFHKDPMAKIRPTDIYKQQFQFLVQNGEKEERQSGQAIHAPKKHTQATPLQKRLLPNWLSTLTRQTQSVQVISTRTTPSTSRPP